MTRTNQAAAPRRPLDQWETGQILDHFVSGFEWSIPTRLELFDFTVQERSPGEYDEYRMLWFSIAPPLARVHAGPGVLEDFLKLESASDQAILAYARRWGPLWLCPVHSLPWQHDTECERSASNWEPDEDDADLNDQDDDRPSSQGVSQNTFQTWYDEPLAGWRDLSRQASATIRLARRLHDGRAGDQADWDVLLFLPQLLIRLVVPSLCDPFATLNDFPSPQDVEGSVLDTPLSDTNVTISHDHEGTSGSYEPDQAEQHRRQLEALGRSRMTTSTDFQRQLLAEVLNYWLELAGVRPRLDWSTAKPTVRLGGHGLIGALAVQLLFDCSRTAGLAVCTSCGTPFLPGPRRPRTDRNIYCSECGLKAASRDAAARYRQTKKYQDTYRRWLDERREGRRGPV